MDSIEQADYIFYGVNGWTVSEWILENVDMEKLYIVGNKRLGTSNGIIYINRNKEWYYSQKVELSEEFLLNNNVLRGIYENHYVDMVVKLIRHGSLLMT